MLEHRLRIICGQGFRRAVTHTDAARVDAASKDHDDIRTERRDLLLHLLTGSLADGHGANDGANADDNTEHGEKSSQLVTRQSPQCHANDFSRIHQNTSAAPYRGPNPPKPGGRCPPGAPGCDCCAMTRTSPS